MANTRCFDSVNKSILSASELSSEKRQQTIYTEIQKNVQQFNTANPVKNNGKKYNRNHHEKRPGKFYCIIDRNPCEDKQ
jgi:protease II